MCGKKKYLYEMGFCPECNEILFCEQCYKKTEQKLNSKLTSRQVQNTLNKIRRCKLCKKDIIVARIFRFSLHKTNFIHGNNLGSFHDFVVKLLKSGYWDDKVYELFKSSKWIGLWMHENKA